jgi:hypothetical protein
MHEDDPIFGDETLVVDDSTMHEDDPIFGGDMLVVVDDDSLAPTLVQESLTQHSDLPDVVNDSDDLCGWLAPPQNPADVDTIEGTMFDSQLTANDDPMADSAPTTPPRPCHYTQCDKFWDSVNSDLEHYIKQPWIKKGFSFDCIGSDWEDNVNACGNAIAAIADAATEFKIGICRDPHWRYFYCDDGDYSKRFTQMVLIYVSNTSDPKKLHSSGLMEIEQIARFRDAYTGCLNKAGGGEGASAGSPHFMYVVWN